MQKPAFIVIFAGTIVRFWGNTGLISEIQRRLKELAYHCFLCGRCTEVCPKGIDGTAGHPEYAAESGQREWRQRSRKRDMGCFCGRRGIIGSAMKRISGEKSILFPVCNFPSFFPETTRYLAEILARETGMGILFDCCGNR